MAVKTSSLANHDCFTSLSSPEKIHLPYAKYRDLDAVQLFIEKHAHTVLTSESNTKEFIDKLLFASNSPETLNKQMSKLKQKTLKMNELKKEAKAEISEALIGIGNTLCKEAKSLGKYESVICLLINRASFWENRKTALYFLNRATINVLDKKTLDSLTVADAQQNYLYPLLIKYKSVTDNPQSFYKHLLYSQSQISTALNKIDVVYNYIFKSAVNANLSEGASCSIAKQVLLLLDKKAIIKCSKQLSQITHRRIQ